MAAYFNIGMFAFFAAENFLIFEPRSLTYVVGTLCAILIPVIAYCFFVKMPRRWVVSDEEILEQIGKRKRWEESQKA